MEKSKQLQRSLVRLTELSKPATDEAGDKGNGPAESPKRTHVRVSVHLPTEVLERMRAAVYWTPGATLTELATEAIEEKVTRMEKKNGSPFDPIPAGKRVSRGRPVGR